MARRIATVYKQLELDLSCQQLEEFMKMFSKSDFRTEVRVYENGDTEFILFDEENQIPLAFRNLGSRYTIEGSYKITDWKLAQAMQKAVREFKGHALVHRIYEHQIMHYQYEHGIVTLIKECKGDKERTIYQFDDFAGKLVRLYSSQVIEDQIAWTQLQIDFLLDQRIKALPEVKNQIDETIQSLSRELFLLEG
jgi:hypothetical protein